LRSLVLWSIPCPTVTVFPHPPKLRKPINKLYPLTPWYSLTFPQLPGNQTAGSGQGHAASLGDPVMLSDRKTPSFSRLVIAFLLVPPSSHTTPAQIPAAGICPGSDPTKADKLMGIRLQTSHICDPIESYMGTIFHC